MSLVINKSEFLSSTKHAQHYVRYIDKQSTVFDVNGKDIPVDIAQDEIEAHSDSIFWTQIYSLRRSDVDRLSLDRNYFKALIATKKFQIAKIYNILPANLRCYCSFHDKDYHPHLHIMFYSANPREGYVNGTEADRYAGLRKASYKFKSLLSNAIFDLDPVYEKKSEARDLLREELQTRCEQVANSQYPVSATLTRKVTDLHNILKDLPGKKQYGYLPADVKAKVDDLLVYMVDKDDIISGLYDELLDKYSDFLHIYNKKDDVLAAKTKAYQQKFFHPGKGDDARFHNAIIKAVSAYTIKEAAAASRDAAMLVGGVPPTPPIFSSVAENVSPEPSLKIDDAEESVGGVPPTLPCKEPKEIAEEYHNKADEKLSEPDEKLQKGELRYKTTDERARSVMFSAGLQIVNALTEFLNQHDAYQQYRERQARRKKGFQHKKHRHVEQDNTIDI